MRNYALDGVRGVAAAVVVVYHFICAFLPDLLFSRATDTPINFLFNGVFSVVVFFVLSGYVVCASAAQRRNPVALNVGLRYVRLAAPAMISALFAWMLIQAFPHAIEHLRALMPHNPSLRAAYAGDAPGPLVALYQGGVEVFLTGESRFNAVLWTMQNELIASVLIYLVYGFTSGRTKWILMGALASVPLVFRSEFYYEAFIVGCLLYEFRGKLPARFAVPAFVVGLLLGSTQLGLMGRLGLPELPSVLAVGVPFSFWYVLGASFVVYGVLYAPALARLFETRIPRILGRLSFPLYLVHAPIQTTVIAALYGRIPIAALFALCVVLVGLASWAMDYAAERPTLAFIRWAQKRSRPRAGFATAS
jgi:peptidoglycan/LPS O-acetylase OafA/YrhL